MGGVELASGMGEVHHCRRRHFVHLSRKRESTDSDELELIETYVLQADREVEVDDGDRVMYGLAGEGDAVAQTEQPVNQNVPVGGTDCV